MTKTSATRSRGQIFVPYNGKIADITHADTLTHTLDLAAALSETRKIIAVVVSAVRIAGTESLYAFPNEGAWCNQITTVTWADVIANTVLIIIANNTNRLQYRLSLANDDFDLYCFGYVVEA